MGELLPRGAFTFGPVSELPLRGAFTFGPVSALPPAGAFIDQKKYQRWIAPLVEADWENVGCPLPSVAQQAERDDAN